MNKLTEACRHALRQNLALRRGESVLIITDAPKLAIGRAFEAAARQLTRDVALIEIAVLGFNGQEPPAGAAAQMLQADVILLPLTRSLSWTKARRQACRAGARIASMARITEDCILRTFTADYDRIKKRANRLADLLDEASRAHVTTNSGTELELNLDGRHAHGRSGGLYTEKGKWGNLPCGEAFIAPVPAGTDGVYFVDASHAGAGPLDEPIRIAVEHGFAVTIEGGAAAERLRHMLAKVGDAKAYNIAEFGIGCNDRAQVCGVTLEDEKALGTCHIALGSNLLFGGDVDVGVHVDGVLTSPTIALDDRLIMRDGKLLIDA